MADKTGHLSGARHGRRVWPLFFLLALAVLSLLLHLGKSRRQKEARAAKQQFSAMARVNPLEKVKAQRGRFYKIQYYLNYPSTTSYAVADFIRRLNSTIPPQQLRDVQIDPSLQNFSFRLTVKIATAGLENAHSAAAVYLEKIRNFPEITQIALARMDPLPDSGGGEQVHFFSITGQADMR
jgi:hypothetical protein